MFDILLSLFYHYVNMRYRDETGAEKFSKAMLRMSGKSVFNVGSAAANNSSGSIYKINRLKPPTDGLRVRQGFGRGEYEGSLGFQFTLAKTAQVDGFMSLEDLAGSDFSTSRNNGDKNMFLRTVTEDELEKLIAYLEEVCPKISQALWPEWHASRD